MCGWGGDTVWCIGGGGAGGEWICYNNSRENKQEIIDIRREEFIIT